MVLTRLNTRRVRWVMWSVLAFGYLLMSFTRVSTAVLAESLTLAFNITATELGLLHSSFFYFYAAMQLPAGVLVDRYGPRRVAGTGTFVMGFGAVAFAMSDSFLVSFLARALVGFGGSVIFLAILRFAVTWFRADEYATVTGLTIGVSALGGIIATTPLAIAASVIGWRSSMLVIGSLCVVSALFIFLSVRDRPVDETDSESPELTADGGPTSLRDDLRSVLGGSDVWALGILNFLILGVNFTIIGLWGVPYLVHLYDLSVARASLYVLVGNVGLLIGSPLFGWIADRTAAHTALVLISTLVFCVVFGTLFSSGHRPRFRRHSLLHGHVRQWRCVTRVHRRASATPRRGERNGERDNKQRRLLRGCRRARSNGYGARCLLDREDRRRHARVLLYRLSCCVRYRHSCRLRGPRVCTLDSPDSTAKIALCDQRTDS